MTKVSPDTALRDFRCLVTGGAGFIGSHLVEALVRQGAAVTVLDDLSNGCEENLSSVRGSIRFVRGSILDEAVVQEAMSGCSVVFHEAALGSVPRSVETPELYHRTNTTGTMMVLEAARREGVKRLVYAASSSAYGDQRELPKIESMRPDPRSPYAYTKLAGEHIVRSWALSYGIQALSLRYFNVFGPRQRADSQYAAVIPRWADALRRNESPVVYGDGLQTRDFTHVANVVHANILAATTTNTLQGEVINVGCGGRYTLLHLLKVMSDALGATVAPTHVPTRAGDVRDSEASIQLAHDLIGYLPVLAFEEGLRQTLASAPRDTMIAR